MSLNEASWQPQAAPRKPPRGPQRAPRDPRNRPPARCRGILLPEASRKPPRAPQRGPESSRVLPRSPNEASRQPPSAVGKTTDQRKDRLATKPPSPSPGSAMAQYEGGRRQRRSLNTHTHTICSRRLLHAQRLHSAPCDVNISMPEVTESSQDCLRNLLLCRVSLITVTDTITTTITITGTAVFFLSESGMRNPGGYGPGRVPG